MENKPSVGSISAGSACDNEVVAMVGIFIRLAGWKSLLEALQSVAAGSDQPRSSERS